MSSCGPSSSTSTASRATVEKAQSDGVLDGESAAAMLRIAKSLYYAERTYAHILACASGEGVRASIVEDFRQWMRTGAVNQKRDDAVAMLGAMRACLDAGAGPRPVTFVFEESLWWHELRTHAAETGLTGDDARVLEALSRDPVLRERWFRRRWAGSSPVRRPGGTAPRSTRDTLSNEHPACAAGSSCRMERQSTAGAPRIASRAPLSSTFSKPAPSLLARLPSGATF